MMIELLILLFIMPIATVGISLLYQKCMEEEMIFEKWFNILSDYYENHKGSWKSKLVLPLGICIYCYSTWIGIVSSIVLYNIFNITIIQAPLVVLLYIGVQYIYLELIIRLIA